jgi:acyl-CoA synthetase (AMP-forming)/AMP-acid ligase II
MKMARIEAPSLSDYITHTSPSKRLYDQILSACIADLNRGTRLGGWAKELVGRSVLLATSSQFTTALALIELDGRARRLTILQPNIDPAHISAILAAAEIDTTIVDSGSPQWLGSNFANRAFCSPSIVPAETPPPPNVRTEWLLLTSGTTGAPKLVAHTLADLTAAITARSPADGAAVWATFYDIRRYGGLQIFLRAVLGGASLVLSCAGESVGEHLTRLGRHSVTHLSGTPSHWRQALMNPAIRNVTPRYVRLSGEIADQTILDALRTAFPNATVGHAFASTEAGVAFDVNDGLAGFPVGYVDSIRDGVEMKVMDGSLRIRSPRLASRYIGTQQSLIDEDGFVDTGDIVERRGDRYQFIGRKDGVINIGGLKVHPEEVEAVINRHPQVRMSLVRSKKSPVTGSIIVADIVLNPESEDADIQQVAIKEAILRHCREALPRHKIPAFINVVTSVSVATTGKIVRSYG